MILTAVSRATANGRSKPLPSLRMSAGAKFAVTFMRGSFCSELKMALFTRWRLSVTALSGKPTMMKYGSLKPCSSASVALTSTVTGTAFSPSRAALLIWESTGRDYGIGKLELVGGWVVYRTRSTSELIFSGSTSRATIRPRASTMMFPGT